MSYKFTTGSVRRGDIYAEEDTTGDATYIDWGQDTITFKPGDGAILFLEETKVGINTVVPDYELDVAGDIGVDEYIYHNGDANTYIQFDTDEINFVVGAANMIYLNEGGAGAQADKVTINNDLADVDFQVKGASEANLIRTAAATDRVGIATDTPAATLHVTGDISGSGDILLDNTQGIRIKASGGYQGVVMDLDNANHLNIGTWTGSDIRLYTNSADPKEEADIRMLIDGASPRLGNVGIGTGTEAYSRLSISGSVQFNVTVFTADDTLDDTHHVAVGDCNSADITLTLPSASNNITGRQYIIKRADSSNSNAQAFVIAPGSGDAIDGTESNITGIDDGTSHTLICIGASGWILVDKYVGI